jgi:hypothetical protein
MNISQIVQAGSLDGEQEKSYREYIANRFADREEITEHNLDFLIRWRTIVAYAQENSAAEAVNRYVSAKRPCEFAHPGLIRMELYHSFAGEIPIIYCPDKDDFELLVTNTVYKGIRPENLSQTGASFAYGKATRFIMLSSKPYSNIPAAEMGLSEQEWAEKSMIIRREHECTHYFTKQAYGISENRLHDEIMADFFGIYEAFGYYKAEYFLRFMGIVGSSGGRIRFYTEGLPEKVCRAVAETAESAAAFLEKWSESREFKAMGRAERVRFLCRSGLDGMCEKDG